MLLPEYRSKELLAKYGVPVPPGFLARTANDAEMLCGRLNTSRYVVKSQILAGGRGLAGGVKIVDTPSAVGAEVERLLGHVLVTDQTGPRGEIVQSVYVEKALDIVDNFYVALALDAASGGVMLLASAKGGVEFEERARMDDTVYGTTIIGEDTPEEREKVTAFLGEHGMTDDAVCDLVFAARQGFVDNELTLAEINPLVRTRAGEWFAADAKAALDPNAVFRHPEFEEFAHLQHRDTVEAEAQANDINMVKLDGTIGVVVNGAGLGLATHDMIVDAKGRPANFMDIRTTATSLKIAKGVQLLLADPNVRCILLNVHGGGITLGDTVAEGVSVAYGHAKRKVPLVARVSGQNADRGLAILKEHRLPVEIVGTTSEAVARAVALAS